jgi:DNA polymerase-3 subunit beta
MSKGGPDVKFRVERDVLAEAVTWVARGLPARPPVPVLAGVLIEADPDGTLTLSAFDYEVSARITVAAEVSEGGTVLVLGRLLADISHNLPARPIEVETEGNKVQVTCGSSRFSLLQMPSNEYPTLPSAPEPSGTIAGDVFTQAVAQVAVAADRGDTLPILTGVRVEIDGDRMTLLATDRYRLAMRELTWNPGTSDSSQSP